MTTADAQEVHELLQKWRTFKRRAFNVLVFFCALCFVVGFSLGMMGIKHG